MSDSTTERLAAALKRYRYRRRLQETEERLRSVPSLTWGGFVDDDSLPPPEVAFTEAIRYDAPVASRISLDASDEERQQWLRVQLRNVGIENSCHLYFGDTPWSRIEFDFQGLYGLWQIYGMPDFSVMAPGSNKTLTIISDECEDLAIIANTLERS